MTKNEADSRDDLMDIRRILLSQNKTPAQIQRVFDFLVDTSVNSEIFDSFHNHQIKDKKIKKICHHFKYDLYSNEESMCINGQISGESQFFLLNGEVRMYSNGPSEKNENSVSQVNKNAQTHSKLRPSRLSLHQDPFLFLIEKRDKLTTIHTKGAFFSETKKQKEVFFQPKEIFSQIKSLSEAMIHAKLKNEENKGINEKKEFIFGRLNSQRCGKFFLQMLKQTNYAEQNDENSKLNMFFRSSTTKVLSNNDFKNIEALEKKFGSCLHIFSKNDSFQASDLRKITQFGYTLVAIQNTEVIFIEKHKLELQCRCTPFFIGSICLVKV